MTEMTNLLCNLCLHLDGQEVPVEYGVVINKRAFDLCAKHFQEPLVKFEREYMEYGDLLQREVRLGNGKASTRADTIGVKKRYAASHSRHVSWKAVNSATVVKRPPYIPSFYEQEMDDE